VARQEAWPDGRREATHPDFVVDESVVGVLVKLLLGVHVDAVGPQLLPDLRGEMTSQ